MPEPETAKWEERALKGTVLTAKANVDVAILIADSLGKKMLQVHLQRVKKSLERAEHFL
jgi:hypothetical protein